MTKSPKPSILHSISNHEICKPPQDVLWASTPRWEFAKTAQQAASNATALCLAPPATAALTRLLLAQTVNADVQQAPFAVQIVQLAVQETALPAHQISLGAKVFAANARTNLNSSETKTDASVLVRSATVFALLALPVNISTRNQKHAKLAAARPPTARPATCTLVNVTPVKVNTL